MVKIMSRVGPACSFGGFRKQIIGMIVVTSLLVSAGWFVAIFGIPGSKLYLFGTTPSVKQPRIDGIFDPNEGWLNASYHDAQYVAPFNITSIANTVKAFLNGGGDISYIMGQWMAGVDPFRAMGISYSGNNAMGYKIAYNHVYIYPNSTDLLLFIDYPSVIAGENDSWQWLCVAIDTDGSQDILASPTHLASNGTGFETLLFNVTAGAIQNGMGIIGYPAFDAIINSTITNATVKPGWGPSMNYATPHRFFEVDIPMSQLCYKKSGIITPMNPKLFGIGVDYAIGNGPIMDLINSNTTGPEMYFSMPAFELLPLMECQMFLCGNESEPISHL